MTARRVVLGGLLGGLIYALQVAMSGLPNIEPVSLLVILFTLHFPRLMPGVLAVFWLLESFTYGFHVWTIMYLYVWPLLALAAWLCRAQKSPLFWAVLSGAFGLAFGALCAIPYLVLGGPSMALAWWVSGIPFDVVHCVGNAVAALVLFRPLDRALTALRARTRFLG
mgnify:CR=1 FL=1